MKHIVVPPFTLIPDLIWEIWVWVISAWCVTATDGVEWGLATWNDLIFISSLGLLGTQLGVCMG